MFALNAKQATDLILYIVFSVQLNKLTRTCSWLTISRDFYSYYIITVSVLKEYCLKFLSIYSLFKFMGYCYHTGIS